MINRSFIHLPGIGAATEKRLWEQGLLSWDDLSASLEEVFRGKRAAQLGEALEESRAALESGEMKYFADRLPKDQTWRMVPLVVERAAYLDIETTGLGSPPDAHSTTIAVSFGGELFVEHETEKKRLLLEKLNAEAGLFVTFNGACFDLPFLRREFGMALDQPHVDLRMWFRRLGFKGGLKKIQQAFPEIPARKSMDIDGFDAVRLWRLYERGISGALETLMTYNAEDAVVLEPLLHLAYAREIEAHPWFRLEELPPQAIPEITTEIHGHIYSMLKGEVDWSLPSDW